MKEIILIKQKHLKSPLTKYGFNVYSIDSYESAILEIHNRIESQKDHVAAILCEVDSDKLYKQLITYIKSKNESIPVFVITQSDDSEIKKEAFAAGATDIFTYGLNLDLIAERINQLEQWNKSKRKAFVLEFKMPRGKRIFDIAVSGFLLLMLFPLFLIITLLIKSTSKGPAFYSSPRVGTGYKIFPFYKFRSMRVDADQMLKKMEHLNHYNQEQSAEPTIPNEYEMEDGPVLISDEGFMNEKKFLTDKEKEEKQAFFKIQNDPRITKVGHFIRKTSIDELPQLFNVLLGHMSIVGNRPLPLYEAEKLTSDDWAMRFMAPAGITGLWQVTERGKANTTEESRKKLDIIYARKYSMWMDLKIMVKTPLAAIQQEKV